MQSHLHTNGNGYVNQYNYVCHVCCHIWQFTSTNVYLWVYCVTSKNRVIDIKSQCFFLCNVCNKFCCSLTFRISSVVLYCCAVCYGWQMQDQQELHLKLVQKLSLCIVILVDLIQQYDLGQTSVTSLTVPTFLVEAIPVCVHHYIMLK